MNQVKSERDPEMLSQSQIDSSGDDNGVRASLHRRAGPKLKKGPWTPSEDAILEAYIKKHGVSKWNAVQRDTGLLRCGKSCRLRWKNHLRPNLKKGAFTKEEENLIIKLHSDMGNKWAQMATYLPGRTDNEIKNYWNARLKKCQRTKTHVYPDNICVHVEKQDKKDSTDSSFIEKLGNDLIHGNEFFPTFTWDNIIDGREALSYLPQLSDVSISNIIGQSFASKSFGFMDQVNQVEVLNESNISLPVSNTTTNDMFSSVHQSFNKPEKLMQSFGFDVINSCDEDTAPFTDASFGSYDFSSSNFSASRPTVGPSKLELPSFQDAGFDPNNWSVHSKSSAVRTANLDDLCIYPSVAKIENMCMAPTSSVQSEDLFPESHACSFVEEQHLSMDTSNSGPSCDAAMKSSNLDICGEHWEQDLNFDTLIASTFSAPSLCSASPDEFQYNEFSSNCAEPTEPEVPQYEQGKFPPHTEDLRPDALFF